MRSVIRDLREVVDEGASTLSVMMLFRTERRAAGFDLPR